MIIKFFKDVISIKIKILIAIMQATRINKQNSAKPKFKNKNRWTYTRVAWIMRATSTPDIHRVNYNSRPSTNSQKGGVLDLPLDCWYGIGNEMNQALGQFWAHNYRLNWAKRTFWGWWDNTALQTQNSNPGGLRPSTLPRPDMVSEHIQIYDDCAKTMWNSTTSHLRTF